MSRSVLSRLAASARVGVLVAGTALATAAVVGGGTVAVQTVADQRPASAPAPAAENSSGTEKRGLAKLAKLQREVQRGMQDPAVPFICDPTKTHGQNVSAYVHSLPKGPGRGALVSQAAKSDCGKPADAAADTPEDATTKAEKPAKPGKPESGAKPEKRAEPGKAAEPGSAAPEKGAEPGSATPESVGPQRSAPAESAKPESAKPESAKPDSTATP